MSYEEEDDDEAVTGTDNSITSLGSFENEAEELALTGMLPQATELVSKQWYRLHTTNVLITDTGGSNVNIIHFLSLISKVSYHNACIHFGDRKTKQRYIIYLPILDYSANAAKYQILKLKFGNKLLPIF